MKTDGYAWPQGAELDDHSRRKHKILREYFHQYLTVRCQLPQQSKFRLAIVDGFSGGGRYQCGSAGSPIIFIEELDRALEAINLRRAMQGLGAIARTVPVRPLRHARRWRDLPRLVDAILR